MEKIVRTICYFTKNPSENTIFKLEDIEEKLEKKGFKVQEKRVCCPNKDFTELKNTFDDNSLILGKGQLDWSEAKEEIGDFIEAGDVNFNLDLTDEDIGEEHVELLFKLIEDAPSLMFSFAYTFNDTPSSPFFPSAKFEKEGFSIGLQATNMAEGCENLQQWLDRMKDAWEEIDELFREEEDYLGIDSSIAPLHSKEGSLVNFIRRIEPSFNRSVLTDNYVKITEFIQNENPNPVGLCGLMLPCLEDFELAEEYEKGNFSIERNLFLSLHSGLGIDTYPVGVDEDKQNVVDILKTVQRLSNKHGKPLSIRFVSDGEAKIGEETDFGNKFLKDVEVRSLK
ncbi:MAG: DUF711 family protein [Candidatus Nanohaloarchaea archaeon]